MAFDPSYEIGQILKHKEIVEKFQCGNMGGMRRSHATNTLVLISDYTKGLYHDKWIGGTLHYTGMGKSGDQDINWSQNATLAESASNGVDVHLFEVIEPAEYIYCGRVALVGKPYTETQPGEDGIDRLVWMYPIRPVPDNNVIKPAMFVFKDQQDYEARGQNVDHEYRLWLESNKKVKSSAGKKKANGVIGKVLVHKTYGKGTITKYDGTIITVKFLKEGIKTLNYQLCLEKEIIKFE